jgi:hypothetical protein
MGAQLKRRVYFKKMEKSEASAFRLYVNLLFLISISDGLFDVRAHYFLFHEQICTSIYYTYVHHYY